MSDWPTVQWQLPDWVAPWIANWQKPLATPAQRMHLVIGLALENVRRGTGGPFAAAVFDEGGQLLAPGGNLVTEMGCSSAHAEMVALSLAQAARGITTCRNTVRRSW